MILYKHAKSELDLIYDKKSLKSEMNKTMYKNILSLIKVFAKQGHSGMSASYCREIFYQLSNFRQLGDLTSNPSEWREVDTNTYQSKRNPSCFSTDFKYYYDINGKDMPKWKRWFIKNRMGMKLIKLNEKKLK